MIKDESKIAEGLSDEVIMNFINAYKNRAEKASDEILRYVKLCQNKLKEGGV